MSRMYTVTPSQAKKEIIRCISKRRVPLLTSSPGVGKSALVAEIAKEFRLKLIDLRLSQCMPEDLNGFPMRNGNKATFTPFDIFPIEGDEIPDGYDGWLLFCDEMTSATKPVQAAAYKLILDRMVGSFKLHDRVAVVAAGNKITDRAVVNQMSTALQSRLIHYELVVDPREWIDTVAYRLNFDYRVTGFIEFMPSKLMDFRPDHQDVSFPCPRTWEFVSDLIEDEPKIDESHGATVSGAVGEGCATEFITFAKEFANLPKYRDIIVDPTRIKVPDEASTKYATMSMLVENFDDKSLDKTLEYVDRFDTEFKIMFFRGAVAKKPTIRSTHAGFAKHLTQMVRYLQ